MMTDWISMGAPFMVVPLVIVFLFISSLILGGAVIGESRLEYKLQQCLSQSGTTWQGGECVIILNK